MMKTREAFLEAIGCRIFEHRVANGLTQFELSELCGVEPNSVHRWEAGKHEPELVHLVALSKIFRISLHELVVGPSQSADGLPVS